jgi:NAD(P)H-dependent flavin oxidoreductase YrpB (nitropropane dioxygenase family)
MLHTRLCDLLGITVPIITAPMGGSVTSVELAAAVSNAGGIGIIPCSLKPPPFLRQEIRRLRELTEKPFGVNVLLEFSAEEQVNVCIEERVPVLSFFWGDPSPYVARAHAAGLKVIDQVGSVQSAQRSARAGVDVIIAQGVEAGGHIAGQVTTMALVPRVVEASEEDTVRTTLFGGRWPNAPHRVLRTAFVAQWLGQEARGSEQREDEPVIGETSIGGQQVPIQRFMGLPPSREATGDIESMGLAAGQSVGLVRDIKPAAVIVRELVEGAHQLIQQRLQGVLTLDRT